MDKDIKVRNITVEDYYYINKWWIEQGYDPPGTDILPMNGLGGVIVEKKEKPIAAAYVYLTNSTMGYIDNLISDPKYFGRDRFDLIIYLIKACENIARKANCREVWATSKYKGILKRCKALGYTITEQSYGLIFANKKEE